MNPGQSVKDRAALGIIRDAVARGQLKPGGTIVEGTAGNTGIGLTLIGSALGYRSVIVIPVTQSEEKKQTLRLLGAELVEVPAVPYRDPNNYVKYSARLADALGRDGSEPARFGPTSSTTRPTATSTRRRRPRRSGPTPNGAVDGFVCAVGSGGTLGGVSRGLKAKRAGITIALADPPGSALYSYYATGTLKAEGSSITEGIGQGRITKNLEGAPIDRAYHIPDDEALHIVFGLVAEEGLCLGASSGVNVAGAIRLARDLGPGHTIVTMLCDPGTRYQSRLFNPVFLKSKSLPIPAWLASGPRQLPSVFAQSTVA